MAKKSIANFEAFVHGFEKESFWVGIDVHKKNYHMALMRSDGRILHWVCLADPERVAAQLLSLGVSLELVAYETGPTGFKLARALIAKGIRAIITPASKMLRPATQGAKTDRLDCMELARQASTGYLESIRIPTEEQEAERGLRRQRNELTDSIRKTKQRIKSFLLARGIVEPAGLRYWSQGAVAALKELELHPADRRTLDSKLHTLEFFLNERKQIDNEIQKITGSEHHKKAMACLQSVPGVGAQVASAFRLEIFDPHRFNTAEKISKYCELAPRIRQSGKSKPHGHILKHRQKHLRSLMVQAAWQWVARDRWAGERYTAFRQRTGSPQKAIVAMARKLAVILWRLSIELRPYRQLNTV